MRAGTAAQIWCQVASVGSGIQTEMSLWSFGRLSVDKGIDHLFLHEILVAIFQGRITEGGKGVWGFLKKKSTMLLGSHCSATQHLEVAVDVK